MRLIENPFKNLVSATGQGQIHHLCYRPEEEAKAVILLIHGMCEHQGRYREFAEFLTGYNFIVYSLDLPGHGKTAKKEDLGFFAKKAGYQKVIKDVDRYIELISLEHPDLPFILFGHSMGSMIARYYLINRPKLPHAAIFCGTVGPNFMSYFGLIFAMFCAFLLGPKSQGKLQNYLLQKAMKNKEFYDKAVQKYNWISRNKESFYSYINDPDRSFVFTHSAYRDLFTWYLAITKRNWSKSIAIELPILMISGDRDPVGGFGKGVRKTYEQLQDTGHDVTLKLYPGARHELLHEINKDEVFADILNWMEAKL